MLSYQSDNCICSRYIYSVYSVLFSATCSLEKKNKINNNKFSLNAVVKRYFLLSSYFKSLYRLCLLSYTIQYMVLEIETRLIIISYLGVINLVIASKNDINGLDIHYTK